MVKWFFLFLVVDLHFEGKDKLIGGEFEGKRNSFRLFLIRSEHTSEMWGALLRESASMGTRASRLVGI